MAVIKINPNLAQEIVNAVKEVVDKNINFVDRNGIIIGSTDQSRIDTFHQAGYESIKSSSNIIVEDNDKYKGSKKGINYPIKINGIPIGAIGITGEPSEISKFGFLVTKITEIFIKEQQLNYRHESDKQRINYVVKSLAYNSVEDKEEIENILSEFKIDVEQKFAIVIMEVNKFSKREELEIIENDIYKVFDIIGNIFRLYIYPNKFIALVNEERYKRLKNIYMDNLIKYNGMITGGVGHLMNLYDTHKSYHEASIALKHSIKNNKILTYIDDLELELILDGLDSEIKKQYTEKILKSLDEEDIKLLETYYKNGMSLKQTSENLYIHKNTLQYRLEKIHQKCGYNPRTFNDSVILYIAIGIKCYL